MDAPLYERKEAAVQFVPARLEELSSTPPGQLAAAFFFETMRDFSIPPAVLYTGGDALAVLFRGACFDSRAFGEAYGPVLAALSAQWPLSVYGTAENGRETCELAARAVPRGAEIVRFSPSGRDQDTLNGLCVRLRCSSKEQAAGFAALLRAMKPDAPCAAVDRIYERFCLSQGLARPIEGAHFCYCPLDDGGGSPAASLGCLSLRQRADLWRVFLQDGVSPKEFDWLLSRFTERAPTWLIEWETALKAVLEELRFSIVRSGDRFEIADSRGVRRRFDFIGGSAGEKMFLKLLFPLGRP